MMKCIITHSNLSAVLILKCSIPIKQKRQMEEDGKKEGHNQKMVRYGRKTRVCIQIVLSFYYLNLNRSVQRPLS